MLTLQLRNRFLFHNIIKHITERKCDSSAKPRENSCFYKSALVQSSVTVTSSWILRSAEMGITSAGMQSRDAECGERIFTRTVRQVKQQTTVHYFVSPPRPPVKTNPQAKLWFQPGWKWQHERNVVCFLFKPRAAFYTPQWQKIAKINTQNAGIVRKISSHVFNRMRHDSKKKVEIGWRIDLK